MSYTIPRFSSITAIMQWLQTIVPLAEILTTVIVVVAFLSLKRYNTENALPASLFLGTIITTIFTLLGLLSSEWPQAFAVATFAVVAYNHYRGN